MEKNQGAPEPTTIISQNKSIHAELQDLKARNIKYPYESNDLARSLARLQQVYAAYLKCYEDVAYAEEEGVHSVTLHTLTKTITIPLPLAFGNDVAATIWKALGQQMDTVVEKIEDVRSSFAKEAERTLQCDADMIRYQQLLMLPLGTDPSLGENQEAMRA